MVPTVRQCFKNLIKELTASQLSRLRTVLGSAAQHSHPARQTLVTLADMVDRQIRTGDCLPVDGGLSSDSSSGRSHNSDESLSNDTQTTDSTDGLR